MAPSMVAGTMLGVELGVRLLSTLPVGISAWSAAHLRGNMFSLFLYTQIETRRPHRKAEQMTRDGQKIMRRSRLEPPSYFQRIPFFPSSAADRLVGCRCG
jgi:hypothetical protein